MFKKILLVILILLLIGIVAFAIIFGLGGNLFQGALYNVRPIYKSCHVESANFQSDNLDDCEHFQTKLENGVFPDGEYTITTKYTDSGLPDNMIPVTIADNGRSLSCTYLENGYEPDISVSNYNDPLSSQALKKAQDVPINADGTIVKINFRKNDKLYVYDTNICEQALEANISDSSRQPLGLALLDHNGFINSRPLVNEILIKDAPYYTDQDGQIKKDFLAGNLYANFNFAPDIAFKMTIPCSKQPVTVSIPSLTTETDIEIPLEGMPDQYMKTCGSRLYLSLQNTNRADDIQIFDNLNLPQTGNKSAYQMRLSQIARVTDKNTTFPVSFKVSLHLRDRSDSKDVITLGSGLLTVTKYSPSRSPRPSTPAVPSSNTTTNSPITDLIPSSSILTTSTPDASPVTEMVTTEEPAIETTEIQLLTTESPAREVPTNESPNTELSPSAEPAIEGATTESPTSPTTIKPKVKRSTSS